MVPFAPAVFVLFAYWANLAPLFRLFREIGVAIVVDLLKEMFMEDFFRSVSSVAVLGGLSRG